MPCTVVVGLGRSGSGAAKLLHAEGHHVTLLEQKDGAKQQELAADLRQQGIDVELGKPLELASFTPFLDQLDNVVISPGIAWDHPTLIALRQRGIATEGEIAVAWRSLSHLPWIGITGTNGKTTVTHLINHVLETNGLKAPMAGNVGHSATELALRLKQPQQQPNWLVMELSSYQIEAAPEIAPRIGIWTNLTPDHLERHGTLTAYRKIKRGLLERSTTRIFNADDPDLRHQRSSWEGGIWVSSEGPGSSEQANDLWIDAQGVIQSQSGRLFDSSVLAMPGQHNLQNLLLVTATALQTGLSAKAIENSLRSFPGVPHRLERLGKVHGMSVFNDSKATNYDAACVGLKAVPASAVVIAGGQTKNGDPSSWLKQLQQSAASVVLFGSGASELQGLIEACGFNGGLICCDDLNQAVNLAIPLGIKQKAASLLLSPACASFDQYPDFEARGEHFRSLINPMLTDSNVTNPTIHPEK
ncbi:MAG: UDP-N-acetylmuramoyl-L-alanine--D-glutamate ligase [Prochlorococcus sp.]|jgi:UDP-N-acetylmuramoylalanine--D-glutamate ligase|nr:UDP-N-acetylmuramoyl-L-alanine--D-glutamate ligase [Prochlorococcaceae cyanobacterium ETNP18_MAG_1]